jgi:hypothetical protein
MFILKYNFMSIAFTEVPEDMDIEALIHTKHQKLFDEGLTEEHFDIVAAHFIDTLNHLGVKQAEIDEAVGVIAPLRQVFEREAIEAQKRKQKRIMMWLAILVAVLATVAYYFMQQNM